MHYKKKKAVSKSISSLHRIGKKMHYKKKGQVLMEAIFLALFACAFLATLAHLFEKGKTEIQLSRDFSIKDKKTTSSKKAQPFSLKR